MIINDGDVVLFQGDSVTDAGRENDSLGDGYPKLISGIYSAKNMNKNVKFVNRGVSGNRVCDLKQRWQEDCLDIKPDVLSILIGINDCWRNFDSDNYTSPEEFENTYRYILNEVKTKLPKTKIVLLEPFVMPYPADRKKWRVDLDPKIHVIRKLAKEFETFYIPLDGIFNQAFILKEDTFWSQDGVHPSNEGHALIAKHWLKVMDK